VEPKYLGKTVSGPVTDLDTFPAPEGIGTVVMNCDELTSFCPVTGQPDFYTVTIEYDPDALCIESKSLKLFLWGFRDQALFCEQLAVDLRDRVVASIRPRRCVVTLRQKARGGISIDAVSRFAESD
jgi:7-cyano-7-deazaguanine reductase